MAAVAKHEANRGSGGRGEARREEREGRRKKVIAVASNYLWEAKQPLVFTHKASVLQKEVNHQMPTKSLPTLWLLIGRCCTLLRTVVHKPTVNPTLQ